MEGTYVGIAGGGQAVAFRKLYREAFRKQERRNSIGHNCYRVVDQRPYRQCDGLNLIELANPSVRVIDCIESTCIIQRHVVEFCFAPPYDRSCASISPSSIFVSLLPVKTTIEDQPLSTQLAARSTH